MSSFFFSKKMGLSTKRMFLLSPTPLPFRDVATYSLSGWQNTSPSHSIFFATLLQKQKDTGFFFFLSKSHPCSGGTAIVLYIFLSETFCPLFFSVWSCPIRWFHTRKTHKHSTIERNRKTKKKMLVLICQYQFEWKRKRYFFFSFESSHLNLLFIVNRFKNNFVFQKWEIHRFLSFYYEQDWSVEE